MIQEELNVFCSKIPNKFFAIGLLPGNMAELKPSQLEEIVVKMQRNLKKVMYMNWEAFWGSQLMRQLK